MSHVHAVCSGTGPQECSGPIGKPQETSNDWLETMTNRLQKPTQERKPKLAQESQITDKCFTIFLHCGARPRTPIGLASFAWCDTYSRDVAPPLLPPCAKPTDSPMADEFEHSVADISCEDLRTIVAGTENKRDVAPSVYVTWIFRKTVGPEAGNSTVQKKKKHRACLSCG